MQIAPSATPVSSPLFLIVRPKLIATPKGPPGLSKKTMADRIVPSVPRNFPSSPSSNIPVTVMRAGVDVAPSAGERTLTSAACAAVARRKMHNLADEGGSGAGERSRQRQGVDHRPGPDRAAPGAQGRRRGNRLQGESQRHEARRRHRAAESARRAGRRRSVLEQAVDTSTAAGRAFFAMLAVFAAFETDVRRERQLEGIAAAKRKGIYEGGKPSPRPCARQATGR